VGEPLGDTLQTTERLADHTFRAEENGERFSVYFEAYRPTFRKTSSLPLVQPPSRNFAFAICNRVDRGHAVRRWIQSVS
jgi:hypothetical protein